MKLNKYETYLLLWLHDKKIEIPLMTIETLIKTICNCYNKKLITLGAISFPDWIVLLECTVSAKDFWKSLLSDIRLSAKGKWVIFRNKL